MQYISRVIWDMILAVLKGILHECFIDTINVEYGLPHSLCVMGGLKYCPVGKNHLDQ